MDMMFSSCMGRPQRETVPLGYGVRDEHLAWGPVVCIGFRTLARFESRQHGSIIARGMPLLQKDLEVRLKKQPREGLLD